MTWTGPRRFVALVVIGWTAARVAVLAPWTAPPMHPSAPPPAVATQRTSWPPPAALPTPNPVRVERSRGTWPSEAEAPLPRPVAAPGWPNLAPSLAIQRPTAASASSPAPPLLTPASAARTPAPPLLPGTAPALPSSPSRWSLSAYLFLREGSGRSLAAGGTLGGSQAGARLTVPVAPGVALSARAYAPLESRGGEAALGLDWRPLRQLPVHLLVERRQRLKRGGRSALSVLAYGGGERLAGPLVAEAYGQAGLVGLNARDLFADGAVRIGVPLGDDLRVGLGAWGAAQPGLARLDIGPQLSWRLPVAAPLRLFADYRIRVAGDAAPASGPALTLAADF